MIKTYFRQLASGQIEELAFENCHAIEARNTAGIRSAFFVENEGLTPDAAFRLVNSWNKISKFNKYWI